ncbi:MAG TPA: DUF4249 family protein [Chitinophagaceae bacterium]|nr:DUF4249 family protein [Chitinophagaceae bacterium]
MRFLGFLIIIFFLVSCEKNINFDLHDTPDVLVVDASIENSQPPIVVLTKSMDYFGKISPDILANSFVHNADVRISNGILTHKLKEYFIDSTGGYKIWFYSIDTTNLVTAFTGQFNTAYSLKINADGKEYTATTTIPTLAKKPDTLWWKPAPFAKDSNKVIVITKASDPPGLGNYIRYYTKKNSGSFLAGESSVYDDQFVDGTTYELPVDPGIDRNNKVKFDDNYFKRGDTVTIKLCNIDKVTYKFWSTMEFSYGSIGNPFSSPNKVIGNISNGALGAFCGYAAFYKTLIIPK